jgi:hypothetical protein
VSTQSIIPEFCVRFRTMNYVRYAPVKRAPLLIPLQVFIDLFVGIEAVIFISSTLGKKEQPWRQGF